MSKAQVTDILLIGLISGVVAVLTSMMGISGTIIGAVVTSLIAEFLKTFFKEPLKDKISERQQDYTENYPINSPIEKKPYQKRRRKQKKVASTSNESHLTTKVLFIFPLVVILIIELIHFLGTIGIIPYDIFLNLESVTNWKLFRTIGYSLIIMGAYSLLSKKIGKHYGVLLIIVGLIELIFGYADTNIHASMIFSFISSMKEYINIAIILTILYTVLTVRENLDETEHTTHSFNTRVDKKRSKNDFRQKRIREDEIYYEDDDDNYYYF
ncbi:MAG: hypothetical protein BZ136_02955 [Methanosphaera sp. rholeuAM74]|nr:MAG: hypothetical protein BZ136_02955 [Methanosphaera sp. rholeuAM74]